MNWILRMPSISSLQLLMINSSIFYVFFVQSHWSIKCTQKGLQVLRSEDVWPQHLPQGSIAGYHIKTVWPAYCYVLAFLLEWTNAHLNPFLFIFLIHLSFPTCINFRAPYLAPSPRTLFIFLSFNHTDFIVSLCQMCFVYCYITFIFCFPFKPGSSSPL